MAKSPQSGSILRFVLIGTLLAVLLVGGIVLVRQNSQNIAKTPTSTSNSSSTKGTQVATDQSSANSNQTTTGSNQTSTSSSQPADVTPSAPAQPSASSSSQSSELPVTGPTDGLWAVLVVGILAAAITAYRKSLSPLLT